MASTMLDGLWTPPPELCYTVIPMVLCLLSVNFFFKNFLVLAWWCMKVAIAGLVYIQVRQVVMSSFGADPLCIESRLLGVPAGTINAVASLGLHVAKTRVLGSVRAWCPTCMTPPPPPPPAVNEPEQWVTWISDGLYM